jgi:cysteine synthase A
MRHEHILSTIGQTPIVRLARIAPPHVELYAKLESFNPMSSVKDRMALAVIEAAEAQGRLVPGQTVVEATSGNTGIALAMVCARKGYPLVIVMAENFSIERRRLMRFLGARVVLTPAARKGSGMLAKAQELAQAHGWFLPRQFDNEANAHAHERGTALEILREFADRPLTHWVTGSGTGGTLLGVGRVLRREAPDTRIVVCEPDNSPILASGIGGEAALVDGVPASHPQFRPHLMQGWTPDFVPGLVRRAHEEGLIDEVQPIPGARALEVARDLARREGILAGITGGATVAGALLLAERLPAGSRILAMVPDTGERYLSTPLFADIEAEMDTEEWEISRSTPGVRFDAPAAGGAAPAGAAAGTQAVEPPAVTAHGRDYVRQVVHDESRPVVMFALQWCEFCWTLRRFFQRIGVPLHAVELDAPALQAQGQSTQIRAALQARTGQPTIPQVFVGGQWLGGCMDTLAAWRDGRMQQLLEAQGVPFDARAVGDPEELLPGWLQPRERVG